MSQSQFDYVMKLTAKSEGVDKVKKKVDKLNKSINVNAVRQKQATEGMRKQFTALQNNLKPLGKEVKKSLNSMVVPAKTAEQAAEGIIQKQRLSAIESKAMGKGLQSVGWDRIRDKSDGFFKVLNLGMGDLKGVTKNTDGFRTAGGRAANTIRMATHGLKGFRMELLGVMFFGMMVQKTMFGLLKPAMEVFGVFELWRIMLMILFIPAIELLFPAFLELIQWFMKLDPEVQEMIGIFVILAGVFGTALFALGAFGLGIGSILQVGIGNIISFGLVAAAVFAGIVLILAGFMLIMNGDFEGIGLIIAGSGLILIKYLGLWGLVAFGAGLALYMIWKDHDFWLHLVKQAWRGFYVFILTQIAKILEGYEKIKDPFDLFLDNPMIKILEDEAQKMSDAWDAADKAFRTKGLMKVPDVEDSAAGFITMTKHMNEQSSKEISDMETSWSNSISVINKNTKNTMTTVNHDLDVGLLEAGSTTETFLTNAKIGWDGTMDSVVTKTRVSVDEIERQLSRLKKSSGGSSGYHPSVAEQINALKSDPTSAIGDLMGRSYNDFIWRPGQAPVAINPNDTLVGTKGGAGSSTINQTNNITVADTAMIERMIEQNNRSLVDEIRRSIKVPG